MNLHQSSDQDSHGWHWPLLVFVAALRFLNLGFIDLQAWDEALYAMRAKGILLFGGWIDQTSYSVDGLYSSLHPPLYVWLTAIVFHAAEPSETAVRFVSALAGAATLPILYLLGKKWFDPHSGIFAVLFFGLNPFVLFFSRQGQFDSLLVFFLALSMLFLLNALSSERRGWPVAAGLSVGAALMAKLFVGLGIPLVHALWLFITRNYRDKAHRRKFFIVTIVAALVALPWHVFMTLKHGDGNALFFLSQSALIERSLYGIEGNVKPLEVFYFVNQFVVLFPLGAAWFLGFIADKGSRSASRGNILLLWFVVFFVVFSLLRTKLAVYLLPMLVPASLLGGAFLSRAIRDQASVRQLMFLLATTGIFAVWASSQMWRNDTKQVLSDFLAFQMPSSETLIGVIFMVLFMAFVIGIVTVAWRLGWIRRFASFLPALLFFPLGILAFYHVVIADRFQFIDGATALSQLVKDKRIQRIVVAGYERNPQLSWYLGGADLGWRDDLSIRRIIPPADPLLYRSWIETEMEGEPLSALLLIEKDKFVRYTMIDPSQFLSHDYRPVLESRRYTAYVRSRADYLAFHPKEPSPPPLR